MNIKRIEKNFDEAARVLQNFLGKKDNLYRIADAASTMINALQSGHKIIACGNGGSMCDAMHFAEELSGNFRERRQALAAIAISDPSYISCVTNDYGFDQVFSRFIEAFGQKGDVLLAISTSGNSPNVFNAAKIAKVKKMNIVTLTGKNGGKLANLSDTEIRVEWKEYSDRIQEIHIKIIHCLIECIEQHFCK